MAWGIVYFKAKDGRLTGPGRRQYRLFCILDNADPDGLRKRGFDRPQIAVVAGMVKDSGKKFSDRDYASNVLQPVSQKVAEDRDL